MLNANALSNCAENETLKMLVLLKLEQIIFTDKMAKKKLKVGSRAK